MAVPVKLVPPLIVRHLTLRAGGCQRTRSQLFSRPAAPTSSALCKVQVYDFEETCHPLKVPPELHKLRHSSSYLYALFPFV